jgi:hypothetical protein
MLDYSRILRLLVSTFACAMISATVLAAQPPASPWARTVALPTACYTSQDQFAETNRVALEAVSNDASSQKAKNDQISHDWGAKAGEDPMAMAARLQEQMMKDPQAAMKLMQQTGATQDPEAAQARRMQSLEKIQQWDAEEKALIKRYQAAAQAALGPARAHFAALRKRLGITEGWGVGEGGAPDWAYLEYDNIKREADRAYAAFCPQWWGATGAMPAFMKRYKDYLVNERIPYDEETASQGQAALAMGTASTAGYRSTVTLDAVADYMRLAGRLYVERDWEPRCTGTTCRDLPGI